MFPSCRNKEHHCFHVMANLGPTVGLACWLGVSMSPQAPGEEQRPDRGQGSATSLRNTNQAKICSLPKLAEVFPNPVVSSSVLVRFQCVWLDKEQHWGQPWAATAWNCFSEVLSRSMHTTLLLARLWGRSHKSNTAFLPCRGSWWPRITQAMPWQWSGCWWQHPPCAFPWEH